MSDDFPIDFLTRLLDAGAPSGFEAPAARVWRAEAEGFADRVESDTAGNTIATVNPGGSPRVMLAGHIDEIGVMVTHVDEQGYLYFEGIGGWDPQVLVGQRIRLRTRKEEIVGVIGRKPIHLMRAEERDKATKLEELWIDVGAKDRDAAVARGIRVGDPGVIDSTTLRLSDDLIASRAVDNRVGAFVALETIRLLKGRNDFSAEVAAVATAQEEIGRAGGASTAAYRLEPQVALVVDVTFASDAPQIEKKLTGEHRIGGGPVLARGSAVHTVVFERLAEAAEGAGIPYTLQANARATHTDADAIYLSRHGVPTGVIGVPNRYMHSPNQVVSLSDLQAAARLMAEFIVRLKPDTDLVPR